MDSFPRWRSERSLSNAHVSVRSRRSYGSLKPCLAVISHDAERRFLVAIPWMEEKQESDTDDYESGRQCEHEAAIHDRSIGRRRAGPEQRSKPPLELRRWVRMAVR
jgi:hypothetical protein